MRNFLFAITFFTGVCIYAQVPLNRYPPGSEKYYCLDSNTYFRHSKFTEISDSLQELEQMAENAGDQEFVLSLKLFSYIREFGQRPEIADTTEYRLLKLAALAKEQKLKRLEADVLQALGNFYSRDNELQGAAVERCLAAYSIYKDLDENEFPAKMDYASTFGLIYYKLQDYRQAIKYLSEALSFSKQIEFDNYAPTANNLGLCYRNLNLYDSAIFYFQSVYEGAERRGKQVWLGIAQGNIGITYFLERDYIRAEPLLKNDIEYSIVNSSLKNAVNSMVILATIYHETGKLGKAEKILLDASVLCHRKKFWGDYTIAERLYRLLYKVYEKKGADVLSHLYADSALMAMDSTASRYSALAMSQSYQRQVRIKKMLANEQRQTLEKLNQLKLLEQRQLLYKIIIGFLIVVLIMAVFVNRYRSKLKDIATSVMDAPEIVVQKMSIVIISIATCAASLVWTGLYYYYYGWSIITFLPFLYFLLVAPSLIICFFTKKQQLLVNVQLFCMFFITLFIEAASGGLKGGIVILWSCLAPVGALIYQGIRSAAVWMGLFVISIIGIAVFNEQLSASYRPIPETAKFMFDCMNILGPSIVIYFSMQFFVKSVIRDGRLLQRNNELLSNALGELKAEKQKSDDLLLNILPGEVADELKISGTTTARHYSNVTVLFTDFANFTQAAEKMSPQGLIDELHTCFKAFDEITGKYGIEKIKTIGDAYLAVCGLPTADPKHAENVVRAATEINVFMANRLAHMGSDLTFSVRIGIHSGSVVAGIVGVKKFAYDIWGDTVNTAARMEQNSEAGKINISEATYELVKGKFNCEYRGEVEAKGKGGMKMYYVS
jgi:class 3 adenylate cyclase/tetratricopeptide (TPR) repeat protein